MLKLSNMKGGGVGGWEEGERYWYEQALHCAPISFNILCQHSNI